MPILKEPTTERNMPSAEPSTGGWAPGCGSHAATGPVRSGQSRMRRMPPGRIVLALGAVAAATAIALFRAQPPAVQTVAPQWRQITETIAASGLVGGYRDVVVGSQVGGVVKEIRVAEGERVTRGQVLAVVQNNVASAQARQARQALQTAQAQLVQQAARPLPSEIQAARDRAEQAAATARERQLAVKGAQTAVQQADAQVAQAVQQVAQARAGADRAAAQRDLAQTKLRRAQALYAEGAVARQDADQAGTDFTVAQKDLVAAQTQVGVAQAGLQSAHAGRQAAAQGVTTAQESARGALRAYRAAQADLRTLQAQPRAESVAVARQRVRDAASALAVAQAQAGDTRVRAPFDGIVTTVIGQPGASVTGGGLVRLVGTDHPEIRINIDENNLGSLHLGQWAVITSSAYPNARAVGTVRRIGAQVDSARGTIEVAIGYDPRLAWVRPGQTVNVNLITQPQARRLLLPSSAVKRLADRNVVLVVTRGRTYAQTVVTGPPVGTDVPILNGLQERQIVVRVAEPVEPGVRVRVVGGP